MRVPYNTGKVLIGSNYTPPPYVEEDADMLKLQMYLVNDTHALKNRVREKIYAYLVGGIFLIFLAYQVCRT